MIKNSFVLLPCGQSGFYGSEDNMIADRKKYADAVPRPGCY